MSEEFRNFLFKDLNILTEAEDVKEDDAAAEPPKETFGSAKKEYGKIGESEIRKIFGLKNLDVDKITKKTNESAIEISMLKEKMKMENVIDNISSALGASEWFWSGDDENPFRLTLKW